LIKIIRKFWPGQDDNQHPPPIEEVRLLFGAMAKGRKGLKAVEGYQLRNPSSPYKAYFDIKNEDIGANNTYYWGINHEYSIR
jgi:hypothetical protein